MVEIRRSRIFGLGSVLMAVVFFLIGAPILWVGIAAVAGCLGLTV